VTTVGICGTDLHILQVPPAHPATVGCIFGHEFTVIVEEVGSGVDRYQKGDAVLIDPHPGCGQCPQCQAGRPDQCTPLYRDGHCQTIGIFSDGAMTGYTVVPKYSLFKISPEVPSVLATLAKPLACVVSASNKVKVQLIAIDMPDSQPYNERIPYLFAVSVPSMGAGAKKMLSMSENFTRDVVLIHEPGNIGLEQQTQGFLDIMEAAGVPRDKLLTGQDTTKGVEIIRSYFAKYPETNTIFTM